MDELIVFTGLLLINLVTVLQFTVRIILEIAQALDISIFTIRPSPLEIVEVVINKDADYVKAVETDTHDKEDLQRAAAYEAPKLESNAPKSEVEMNHVLSK